uniref:Uncharacterized protein n=1 Tax=Plectus sambesii TaxID=2011161 RepID=A0A914VX09_9BILA
MERRDGNEDWGFGGSSGGGRRNRASCKAHTRAGRVANGKHKRAALITAHCTELLRRRSIRLRPLPVGTATVGSGGGDCAGSAAFDWPIVAAISRRSVSSVRQRSLIADCEQFVFGNKPCARPNEAPSQALARPSADRRRMRRFVRPSPSFLPQFATFFRIPHQPNPLVFDQRSRLSGPSPTTACERISQSRDQPVPSATAWRQEDESRLVLLSLSPSLSLSLPLSLALAANCSRNVAKVLGHFFKPSLMEMRGCGW